MCPISLGSVRPPFVTIEVRNAVVVSLTGLTISQMFSRRAASYADHYPTYTTGLQLPRLKSKGSRSA